ncbi:MAG: tRNA (guanine-N1)-methyltransferase [Cyanobacteria bacterium SID2]|nr:tRNA (guanine-N1)-methyltransferase [Cyanobacteria bacterium SID2]MBP0005001.1 tRNA (guanine-N1)-methyltransferase [Cyanobacteria bacterium SBC]
MKPYREGRATFVVGNAFYRPTSQVGRDLAVLAAHLEKQDRGSLRVLDSMAGCGVRSLRYWLEAGANWVWANEGNPEVGVGLSQNLKPLLDGGCGQLTHGDANRVFFDCYARQDYYDLVDVDSFGSPVPFLNTSLWATRLGGLVYLTSTDGRTATGHAGDQSLRVYAARARAHPSAHEQGLRLIIGTAQQQAATKGLGVEPVFSLFAHSVYRVMLRLVKGQRLNHQNYGFLGYCHECGAYRTLSWQDFGRVSPCPRDGTPWVVSGPMWLGSLHDLAYLQRMRGLAASWGWSKRVKLLDVMAEEADLPPYFYKLGILGKRFRGDIPPRDELIRRLLDRGYRTGRTHIEAQAIKTEADLETCMFAMAETS